MPVSSEPLLRELLANQARTTAQLEDLVKQVTAASGDAREARDLSNRIATILEQQNVGAQLQLMRTEQRAAIAEIRQDFVAANTLLKRELGEQGTRHTAEMDEVRDRLSSLEAERNKVVGVASFFSWLARVAPWLLAGIAAFAAGAGLKDKVP